jgi:hypothetical protein
LQFSAAAEIQDDDAAVVVEDRKTPLLKPTNQVSTTSAEKQPMRRFGYLAAAENYVIDPRSGYLADKETGESVPPSDDKSWGIFGGPP